MGFFNFGKKSSSVTPTSTGDLNLDLSKGISLNLEKGMSLDLSKAPSTLQNIRVSAGWDINRHNNTGDYDLDLCAILLDRHDKHIGCVYYGNKHERGIELDHDNLTGEGDGDDENIFVNFSKISPNVEKILVCVVIYQATERRQSFRYVDNAYVRLVDQAISPEREICRFNLSENGGRTSAVKFAELTRAGAGWFFKAIGEYTNNTITGLCREYR